MKKTYNAPKLINHGSVEAITQLFGTKSRADFIVFGATPNIDGVPANQPLESGVLGSQDGLVTPIPPVK